MPLDKRNIRGTQWFRAQLFAAWARISAVDRKRHGGRQTIATPEPVPEEQLAALERAAGPGFALPSAYRAFMAEVGTAPGWPHGWTRWSARSPRPEPKRPAAMPGHAGGAR